MATNQQESTVNDGAILFAKDNDTDPFQTLSTANANAQQQQPKMTPSNSQTTQQSASGATTTTATTTTASAAPVVKQQQPQPVAAQQEEPIAGDASALFGNGGDNDTNGLFGTTDSLFSNGQGAQEDPFFSQQLRPQPQQTHSATTTASAYDQQQQYSQQHQPGYGGYAQQGQEQYDQQQAYGQQQQQPQYDPSSYYQQYAQQDQQQQQPSAEYDPYADYQFQQQQQDPYAATAYQPTATTSSTTQASTINTTNAAMTTNYYEQSAYDPQQYNSNYYANHNQPAGAAATTATAGASQTQPGETTEQQQYNPYDPAAQQQFGQYGQQQQQQYAPSATSYDATNGPSASAQYDPYNPHAQQQQQDAYSQYSQPQYQQQNDAYSQYSQQYQQQQQHDTYQQYTQQDQQYGQYNYYGADQNATGAVAPEVQSAQQEQYAPFDTTAQTSQQHPQSQQPLQQAGGHELEPSAQIQQPGNQQDAFASMGTGSELQQQDTYAPVGGAESQQQQYDSYAPVGGGAAQVQPQEQQTQDEHKDAFAPVDSGVDTTQHQQGGEPQQQQEDVYAQYNQYNYYAGYDQSGGGASEVQVSQQEEYTSFDTGIQSQQEQFAQFDTGASEVQKQAGAESTQFETGAYQPQRQQEGTTTAESKEAVQKQPQEHTHDIYGDEQKMEGANQQQQQSHVPPPAAPPKSNVDPKQDNEPTTAVEPLHPPPPPPAARAAAVVPETTQNATTNDQVVPPSAYDPYQPSAYTDSTYTQDQTTATTSMMPAVYTPSKPDEAYAATPATVESAYIGRSSIEQNRAETSTVQSGSMLSRLASPQLEQLLPCPDPGCEGENKAKAKFCCECGRPLTSGVSRSVTPIMATAAQPPPPTAAATIPDMSSYQPYAPIQQQQPAGQDMYTPDYSAEPATLMVGGEGGGGVPPSDSTSYYPETGTDVYDPQAAQQQQQMDQPQQAQYPPDPLHRARGCPIVTFGFGGKMCVMFPQTVQRFTSHVGYESGAPITKAMPSAVRISKLKDVVGSDQNPTVASLASFVGPVLNDSKGSTKSKKKEVLAYVDKRIEELTAALPVQEGLGVEYRHAENRVLLWRLIKTLTENDGSIGDGDKMDIAVRALVQPIEKGDENDQGNFSVPAYAQADGHQQDEDAENCERSKKVLGELEACLVKGDRSGAVEYAMQEDLWAHALILGSCVNKDVWKKVVTNFVERELSQSAGKTPRQDRLNVTGDKQALRVLYSLFAGSGAASISEFLPAATPQQRLGTPFGVSPQTQPAQATEDQLQQWRITLTLILANRTPRDTEAITSLGDILRAHGWLDAAHICYLVSPQSSLHSGIDAPHVRLTLIGAEGTTAFSDLDAYYLTELYEFALSTKQGGASSLPFLQGYKLVHAWWLADFGYLTEAQRYCEAIANAIKGYTKGSPYLHRQLLENLKEFGELCEAASGHSIGDTKSWVKNKLSKNMLESMWGSFEGKFNKFVSGEDMPPEEPPVRKSTEIMGTPYDAAKDGPPARSASAFDFRNAARSSIGPESLRRAATPTANMASEAYGDRRSSSPGVRGAGPFAHAFTPLSHYGQVHEQPQQEEQMSQEAAAAASLADQQQQQQQDQYQDNNSAYGYGQPYGGYGYGAQPTNATTSPFGHSAGGTPAAEQHHGMSYYGQDSYSNDPSVGYGEQQQNGYGGWYGSDQQQQQQQQQQQPEPEPAAAAGAGAVPSYEPPTPAASNYEPSYQGEDDDLGFGNTSLTKSKPAPPPAPAAGSGDANNENQAQAAAPEPSSQENPTDKPHEADEQKTADEAKGWRIFSLFSRSSTPSNSTPGEKKAVKANLGEESAFYYDEKEKRWVNKNAPAQAAAAPLPPPPKASSSPAPPFSSSSSSHNALTPPPNAPPSTTASTPPQRPPAMMRSGSTPASATATTPPARSATSPPPSGGARRAGRKPMRSRYVDVFNQPGN